MITGYLGQLIEREDINESQHNGENNQTNVAYRTEVKNEKKKVALVDVLKSIGIYPDGIVGVSVGELVCAYVDGSLTFEQTILAAYWKGKCIIESDLIHGGMAKVEISCEEFDKLCPPDSQKCVDAYDQFVSISGPEQSIENFVSDMNAKGVVAKKTNTEGMAFHSKCMENAGDSYKVVLTKVIPTPKQRSSKWFSTSVQESDWETPAAKLSGPDYYVNNFLNPVYFQEIVQHYIPENAITIGVSLERKTWEAIAKSFLKFVTHIMLQGINHPKEFEAFLIGVGKLYIAGANPNLSKLNVGTFVNKSVA